MLKIIRGAMALLIILACGPAQATVKILATTSDWGALATELGGDTRCTSCMAVVAT
jgi:hypothetical protein